MHHPDTIAQLDALPLDLLINAGALQQRALLHIVRTAPALQPKYAAALAALTTSADPLKSTEAMITALNRFPTAGLFCMTTSPCKEVSQRW